MSDDNEMDMAATLPRTDSNILLNVQIIVHNLQMPSEQSSRQRASEQDQKYDTPAVTRPRYLRAGFAADVNDVAQSGLLHAGEQWAPPQFMIADHFHPTWEFYLQLHGITRWTADRRLWVVRPGDLLGIAPETEHAMAEVPGANIHFVYAAFDPSRPLSRLPGVDGDWAHRNGVLHLPNASRLIEPFAQLIDEVTITREYVTTGLSLAVDRITVELTRSVRRASPTRALDCHPAVQQAQAILNRDYARSWPLKDLAARVGLAPNYLAALFSAEFGRGPHEYQLERKLMRARQLLAASDLSITAIAMELGFSSGQHLARTFRARIGSTPSAYRRAAAV